MRRMFWQLFLSCLLITLLSLLIAPRRGLLAERWRKRRQRRRVQADNVLADLYRLASQHPEPVSAPHAVDALRVMSPQAGVRAGLRLLAARGLAVSDPDGRWRLTETGLVRGRELAGDTP